MAVPIVLSPETAAATKTNYKSPKSEAQTKADSLRADARIQDVLPNGVEIVVPESAIKPAT